MRRRSATVTPSRSWQHTKGEEGQVRRELSGALASPHPNSVLCGWRTGSRGSQKPLVSPPFLGEVVLLVVQHNETAEAGLSFGIIYNSTHQVHFIILVHMVTIYCIHDAVYVCDSVVG